MMRALFSLTFSRATETVHESSSASVCEVNTFTFLTPVKGPGLLYFFLQFWLIVSTLNMHAKYNCFIKRFRGLIIQNNKTSVGLGLALCDSHT